MKRNVFISTSSFAKYDQTPIELLQSAEFEVLLNPYGRKLTREEVLELAHNSDGIIAGTELLDAIVQKGLKNLKVISRCGVGMDNVDIEKAVELGIKVFNTPYGPTLATAELTIAVILSLLRHVSQMDCNIRAGKWQKQMGNLLYGKNIGIIGFGRIGQRVAKMLSGFEVQIAYYDPIVSKTEIDCAPMEMDSLLKWADIVTLHVSGQETLLGIKELRKMKRGSWLINCARGVLVDEQALYQVLKENRLSGAALDAYDKEPYNGPLIELNNVLLTPHVGSYAKEARIEMEIQATKNLISGFKSV